jgi:hypothetical protein
MYPSGGFYNGIKSATGLVSDILQGATVQERVGCDGKPLLESSPGGLQLVFFLLRRRPQLGQRADSLLRSII